MYEVELKLPADHDRVRDRLDAAGATRVGAVTQVDTYYDAPDRDFAETDEALRVREEHPEGGDERTELTYKGPLVEAASKTREEAETGVTDPEGLRRVLEGLAFDPAATVRKQRERYRLDGYTVSLDTVDDAGTFIEVEAEAPSEAAVPEVRAGAATVLEQLGLTVDDQVRTSYLGLVLDADP